MKAFAIILIVLVLAAVGGLGYLYLTTNMNVSFVNCIATDGISQTDYFDTLKSSVSSDTFTGILFSSGGLGTADQYQFLTYTVRFSNQAFLKADVIEIRITPMAGDVLQIGDPEAHSLSPGRSTDLSVTILSDRTMHSVREATVTYYFWGIPFTEKLTLGR